MCTCRGVCARSHSGWAGDGEFLCLNMKKLNCEHSWFGKAKKKEKKETQKKVDPNTHLKKNQQQKKVRKLKVSGIIIIIIIRRQTKRKHRGCLLLRLMPSSFSPWNKLWPGGETWGGTADEGRDHTEPL